MIHVCDQFQTLTKITQPIQPGCVEAFEDIFAITMDETSRPSHLWRLHPRKTPVHLFHESDQRFYLHVYRSSSEQWLLLASASKNTSEVQILPADQPTAEWQVMAPRDRISNRAPREPEKIHATQSLRNHKAIHLCATVPYH